MSPGSASSHEPSPAPVKVKKIKEKSKKKSKASNTHTVTEHGKNEGENPHWAYKPPADSVLADHEVDFGEFDWNVVKGDEDVELWLVRAPENIKPKYLEKMKINPPSSSKGAKIGTLNQKHIVYDVWSIGDNDNVLVGGEEIKQLSCLLPRSSKSGKLFRAPKPITRHLIVSAPPAATNLVSKDPLPYQNPPRFAYPTEVLKHKFLPFGAQSSVDNEGTNLIQADVKILDGTEPESKMEVESPVKQVKEKSKKRKGVGDGPKTSKKVKTADV